MFYLILHVHLPIEGISKDERHKRREREKAKNSEET